MEHFPSADKVSDIRRCCGLQGWHEKRKCYGDHLAWVDIISGGFPCQDISEAGYRAGIDDGERSGLWREYWRLIGELRPRFAVVENVSALLWRDIGRVVGDLAEIGYDAEWDVISACSIGAPHTRERVFIVAYPASGRCGQRRRLEFSQDSAGKGNLRLWPNQPEPVRVADGIPGRMDKLAGLGNAVVPQIAEWIGKRIIEAAESKGEL